MTDIPFTDACVVCGARTGVTLMGYSLLLACENRQACERRAEAQRKMRELQEALQPTPKRSTTRG